MLCQGPQIRSLRKWYRINLLTAEASVCRKTIAPHQIHYAPLYTKYVVPTRKLPIGDAIKHGPPAMPYQQTSNIRPYDLYASSGTQHDFMSEARGAVGTST